MNKKVIFILIIIVFIIAGVVYKNSTSKPDITKIADKLYNPKDCKIKEAEFSVDGTSMEPLIKNRSKVRLEMNYYNCDKNEVKSGDVVIFENPFTKGRIIKRAMVIPGDKVELNKKNGTITVNGKILKNSAGSDYKFKELEMNWLKIYMEKDGKMKSGNYFLFGDNVNNSIDSKQNGPVSKEGILGKVIMN